MTGVDAGGGTATIVIDGRDVPVSLLALDGVPSIGDWAVAHQGYVLEVLRPDEAAAVLAARAGLDAWREPEEEGS